MVYTKQDLINRIANKVGAVSSGSSLSSEDARTIEDVLDAKLSELESLGTAYVSDTERIEASMFLSLSNIITAELASDFGMQGEELSKVLSQAQQAEMTLIKLSAMNPSGEPVKAEYF